jgi:hypothetical protein
VDQKTDLPPVKPKASNPKPSQLELEPANSKTKEQLLQAAHIDPHSPAQADLAKFEADAIAERAREIESDDFNWNTDDAVILKEQRATAVYHNRMGELIVRQKAAWDDDADSFVFVTPENLNAFIDGIAARIRQGGDPQ